MLVKPIHVNISSTAQLYHLSMPFLKNGGLFVATRNKYQLGDSVVLMISLPAHPEPFRVEARVGWISPPGLPGNKVAGIGVHFCEPGSPAANEIALMLREFGSSEAQTATL